MIGAQGAGVATLPARVRVGAAPPEHWYCQRCGQPIRRGRGGIIFRARDPETGHVEGYPANPTPEPSTPPEGMQSAGELVASALLRIVAGDATATVALLATHWRCGTEEGYSVPVEVVPDLERWIGYLLGMEGVQRWMGPRDFIRSTVFWWGHRGEEAPCAP